MNKFKKKIKEKKVNAKGAIKFDIILKNNKLEDDRKIYFTYYAQYKTEKNFALKKEKAITKIM